MTDVRAAVAAGDFDFLGEDRLHEWVVAQRWFASKSREIASINVLDAVTLAEDAPLLSVLMLEARFATGTHEVYQLPVGLRPASEEWGEGVICEIDGWTVYDALTDTEHGRRLLALMRDDADHGEIRFRRVPEGPEIVTDLDVRPTGAEQSNTSVIFGDQLFLKIFRRLEAGDNPELELLRFLTGHGFKNIAPLSGWYEYEGRLIDATLGIVEGFLPSGRDGWELTLDKLAANDESLSGQLHELGEVTGEMHSVLGSDSTDPRFAPERPSTERLSLIFATIDEQIERVWSDLPEDIEALEPLQGRAQDVREVLQSLSHSTVGGLEIRTHGDYHLGQTMLTDGGWVILDFEGEPAAPLSERRLRRSPLRDVAGMLRSFSYAASAAHRLRDAEVPEGWEPAAPLSERRLKRSPLRDVAGMLRSFSYAASAAHRLRDAEVPEGWEQAARDSFLEGYFSRIEDALLPPGQQATRQLLAVFELEKAIYELRYELNNRPDWVGIPVAGIQRLLEAA